MSTSETKPPEQSNGDISNDLRSDGNTKMVSERAKAIARRSFLRRSAGVAAPVVMTLQSGPVMAIASITCQDKTNIGIDPNDPNVANNPSGFIEANPALGNVIDIRNLRSAGGTSTANNSYNTLVDDPASNGGISQYALSATTGTDGVVRCVPTDLGTTGSPTVNGDFELVSSNWVFRGSDFSGGWGLGDSLNPYPNTGPVALFTIDPTTNEDLFIGCYGDSVNTATGSPPPQDVAGATPLTHSCYSSLHPDAEPG